MGPSWLLSAKPSKWPSPVPFPQSSSRLFFPKDPSRIHHLGAELGPSWYREGSAQLKSVVKEVFLRAMFLVTLSSWPTAGEQEAGAAGHGAGPLVLVLLPPGQGNGGFGLSRAGRVGGTALAGELGLTSSSPWRCGLRGWALCWRGGERRRGWRGQCGLSAGGSSRRASHACCDSQPA